MQFHKGLNHNVEGEELNHKKGFFKSFQNEYSFATWINLCDSKLYLATDQIIIQKWIQIFEVQINNQL